MSKNIRLVPRMSYPTNHKFDKAMGCLTLAGAASFTVDIIQTEELDKGAPAALPPFKRMSDGEYLKMPAGDAKKRYVASLQKRQQEEAQYARDKAAFDEKRKQENDTLSWVWQTAGNGMKGQRMEHNPAFSKGLPQNKEIRISFPEILVGGGFAWLEAFTKNDPATGKVPQGLFIRATGTPRIVRVAWTDLDGEPIKGEVNFGSTVLLNIYTAALYGQDVEVELWDRDTLDPNDLLGISSKGSFTTEVLTHELLSKETHKVGVDGSIRINGKSVRHVQKVRIPVLVDPAWKLSAGKQLKIYPTIKSKETGNFLALPKDQDGERYLEVAVDGEPRQTVTEQTNNPVLLGKVETNVARFKPCRFDKIELKKQGKAGSTFLFDSSKNEQRSIKTLAIEIVAGKKETYLLDVDFQTLECERKPKHTTQGLTVITIPKDYELKTDPGVKAEQKVKEEEKKLVKAESSSSFSMMGMKTTQKATVATEKGVVTVREEQIEFDAFYNYDIPQDANAAVTFYKAMQYFWLPNLSADKIRTITAVATTCAFQQNLNIAIYPDIKWTLKFGFNVTKADIEKLNRKGGTFAPLKTFEDKAKEKDEAYFKDNQRQKETLERAGKYFTEKYDLKPKEETAPVEKGTSFKQLIEILQRITVSLEEEHYGGTIKNELTEEFVKQIYEQLRQVVLLAGKALKIIEGDYDEKGFTPQQDKSIDGLMAKLKRKTVKYEMLYPKLSCAGSWYYEQINAQQYPALAGRQGLAVDLMLKAAPLIGVSIKWDILELLCRRHPIAYAILKAVDALLYVLADDDSAIKCDLTVSGQIDTTINLQLNCLAGFKDFNLKGKSAIQAEIKLELLISNTWKAFSYEVIVKRGFGGGVKAGLGITDLYGIDKEGIYVQKILEFEGITLSFSATGVFKVVKESGNRKAPIMGVGGEIKGEITFLNQKFETPKIYFNKILP